LSKHTGFIRNKGMLIVISGFSGAGKSVLTKKLISGYNHYAYSVSATTRAPRPGEVNGVDYSFITKESFEEMIQEGKLLEYNRYVDNYYGTPREYVLSKMNEGFDVILEIDVNGARQVKEAFPSAVTIFVTAPDAKVLADRLKGRGTESREVIEKRLSQTIRETESAKKYDFIIINDDLDETAAHLDRLIQDQHMRLSEQESYLLKFKTDMEKILEEI